jgi:hypothetical protein
MNKEIESLLFQLDKIYHLKKNIEKILENIRGKIRRTGKDINLIQKIQQTFSIRNDKVVVHNQKMIDDKFLIVSNEGGGDCFFYSVIDSGIVELEPHENRYSKVMQLRREVISIIDHELGVNRNTIFADNISWYQISQSIPVIDTDPSRFEIWLNAMKYSSYWADDYMINALAQKYNFIPIMIDSKDKKIYCGLLPFEGMTDLTPEEINRPMGISFTYNNLDSFKESQKKFILFWYYPGIHYENIHVYDKNNHILIGVFQGYAQLNEFAPELVQKIINDCNLVTEDVAKILYLEALEHVKK